MILDVIPQKSDFRRYSTKTMILDVILPEYGNFRHYSSGIQCFYILFYKNRVILDVIPQIVILDAIPQKSDFRRYSTKIMILDVILPEYGDFRHYSGKIQWF